MHSARGSIAVASRSLFREGWADEAKVAEIVAAWDLFGADSSNRFVLA
jgi:hypothetical protein